MFSCVHRGNGFGREYRRFHLRCSYKLLALRFVVPVPDPQKLPLSGFSFPDIREHSRMKTISRERAIHGTISLSLLTHSASVPPSCLKRCMELGTGRGSLPSKHYPAFLRFRSARISMYRLKQGEQQVRCWLTDRLVSLGCSARRVNSESGGQSIRCGLGNASERYDFAKPKNSSSLISFRFLLRIGSRCRPQPVRHPVA
jgi:hypothetical protein